MLTGEEQLHKKSCQISSNSRLFLYSPGITPAAVKPQKSSQSSVVLSLVQVCFACLLSCFYALTQVTWVFTTNKHTQSQFFFRAALNPACHPPLAGCCAHSTHCASKTLIHAAIWLSGAAAIIGSFPSVLATKSQWCDITTGMCNSFTDGAGCGGGREKQKFSLGKINSPTAYLFFTRVSLRFRFLLGCPCPDIKRTHLFLSPVLNTH